MHKKVCNVLIGLVFLATPAVAQAPPNTVEALVGAFVDEIAAGTQSFIADKVRSCLVAVTGDLDQVELEALLAEADYIAGVNAAAAANPALQATLFPALDDCGGTLTVGEFMWNWVETDWAESPEADRVAIGTCLMEVVDQLAFDVKRGIANFRFGDFGDAIAAMLIERQDLAGNIVADMAACNAPID